VLAVDGCPDGAMSGKKVLNNSSMMLGEDCWRADCPAAGTCSCTVGESSRLWMTEWRRRSRRTRPPGRGSSLDDEDAGEEELSASLAGPLLAPGPFFPPPTIRRRTGSGTAHGHGTVLRASDQTASGTQQLTMRALHGRKRQCAKREENVIARRKRYVILKRRKRYTLHLPTVSM